MGTTTEIKKCVLGRITSTVVALALSPIPYWVFKYLHLQRGVVFGVIQAIWAVAIAWIIQNIWLDD